MNIASIISNVDRQSSGVDQKPFDPKAPKPEPVRINPDIDEVDVRDLRKQLRDPSPHPRMPWK